jgi:hypothetical protein
MPVILLLAMMANVSSLHLTATMGICAPLIPATLNLDVSMWPRSAATVILAPMTPVILEQEFASTWPPQLVRSFQIAPTVTVMRMALAMAKIIVPIPPIPIRRMPMAMVLETPVRIQNLLVAMMGEEVLPRAEEIQCFLKVRDVPCKLQDILAVKPHLSDLP